MPSLHVRLQFAFLGALLLTPRAHADLVHRWSFDTPAGAAPAATVVPDSVGTAHGEIRGSGAMFTGTALQLPGGDGLTDAAYVDLPNGLLSSKDSVTFEAWYAVDGIQEWARVWDFGATNIGEYDSFGVAHNGTDYFMYVPHRGTSASAQRVEIRDTTPWRSNQLSNNLVHTLATIYHVTVVWEKDTSGVGHLSYYRDGVLESQRTATINPSEINDVNNWLGRSNWTGDDYLEGHLHEFRIHNHAMTAWEVTQWHAIGSDLSDSDTDGLWDEWENHFFGDLSQTAAGDPDGDNVNNETELERGSHPDDSDTDNDTLTDDVETGTGIYVNANDRGTKASTADSDQDGLMDQHEDGSGTYTSATQTGSNPNLTDSDTDGFDDAYEVSVGRDPTSAASSPPILADSEADWSATGTQGENDWWYGYRRVTDDARDDYHPTQDFVELPGTWWTGSFWDFPSGNPPWTEIRQNQSHPDVDVSESHWPIRRWVAPVGSPSPISVRYFVSKSNLSCGNGVTAAVAINGRQLSATTIDFNDSLGSWQTIHLGVSPGDVLDLVQNPAGPDGDDANDGCDGSFMIMEVVTATDSDTDGLGDLWEMTHFGNLAQSGAGDPDNDNLDNIGEQRLGTDPNDNDSDDDSLLDGVESATWIFVSTNDRGTNPTLADTDGDGLNDDVEDNTNVFVSAAQTGTNPLMRDSDSDGFTDDKEVLVGTLPTSAASVPANGSGLLAYWDFDDNSITTSSADRVAGRVGTFESGAAYTADGGGHSGSPGDRALDLGTTQASQRMRATSAQWLAGAAAKDTLTISFWQSLHGLANSSAFWISAPSEDRAAQAHAPWSDNRISWDTGGCCGGDVSLNEEIPSGTDVTSGWHHFAFVKEGAKKQIWLDGALLLEGYNVVDLPLDMDTVTVGATGGGWGSITGQIDEFAIFADALTPAQIGELAADTMDAWAVGGITDSDGDDMSDDWETHFGLNVGVNDADLDPDIDGHTNLDEFRRGSDPTVNPTPFYSAGSWRVRMVRSSAGIWHLDSAPYQEGVLDVLKPGHRNVTNSSLNYERFINFKEQIFDNSWIFGGSVKPFPLLGGYLAENFFAMEATGQIYVKTAGDVTLGFNSNDGGALWIDGDLVAIYNQNRGRDTSLGTVNLSQGVHDVRFVYWESDGGSGVTLFGGLDFGTITDANTSTVDVLQAFDVHEVATADTDTDGIDDFKEIFFFGDLSRDGTGDFDNDNLTDAQEFSLKTNPTKKDTDGEGLDDDVEDTAGSDPREPNIGVDTDADTFDDDYEQLVGTDPLDNASFPGVYLRPTVRVTSYTQDFTGVSDGTTELPDGSRVINVSQDAAQVESEAMRLSSASVFSARANYALPNLGDAPSQGFRASFRFRLASAGTPADGFSLNYGSINPMDNGGEEGFNEGLSVEFDTWANVSAGEPIGYNVAVNGTDVVGGYSPVAVPIDDTWHTAVVTWEKSGATSGTLNFTVDGSSIFTNLATPGFTPCPDAIFIFSSRTGGAAEDLFLDDIAVVTPHDQTDSEPDGLFDAWEMAYFGNLAQTAAGDPDNDNLTNLEEQSLGTAPNDADSDKDGLDDDDETTTDPSRADTDRDGLADGRELNDPVHPTDPTLFDTDGDGRGDYHELYWGADPNDANDFPRYDPLPFYSYFDQAWMWRIEKVRVLWDHGAAAPLSNRWREDWLFGIVCQNISTTWPRELEIGFRFRPANGHGFFVEAGREGVLERHQGWGGWRDHWDSDSFWYNAMGLAGLGSQDESDPLTFEARICAGVDSPSGGSVSFILTNETTGADIVEASFAGRTPDSLRDQSAVWLSRENLQHATLWSAPGIQLTIGQSQAVPDADDDGMSDAYENTHGLNPNDPSDAGLDPDMDGLTNAQEAQWMTDPNDDDSDNDNVKDGFEVERGYSPTSGTSTPPYHDVSPPVNANADINNNGMSDLWEASVGMSVSLDPDEDLDGDGQNNGFESKAGTDPFDSESMLAPELTITGDDVDVEWDTVPGKRYSLMVSDTLLGWGPAGTWDAASGELSMQRTLAGHSAEGVDRNMYRVDLTTVDSDSDGVSNDAEIILGTDANRADSAGTAETGAGAASISGDYVRLVETIQGAMSNAGTGEPSRSQGARFLMQASFGPTLAEIDRVVALGYEGWIDDQIANQGTTLHEPYIAQLWQDHRYGLREIPNYQKGQFGVPGNNATTPFMRGAAQGTDQLRQRLAFALSQILVASRQDTNLESRPQGICHFYDIFVRHAFGNFEDILWEVSMHPIMGRYLSHIGNQKADPSINRFPDENYAREIMQLFTIGLWELHPNGERILDGDDEPIPTYDNDVIKELARVFTGIWYGGRSWGSGGWDDSHYTVLMDMHADRHDFGEKPIFKNRQAPGRPDITFPAQTESEANGLQEIRDAVAMLFNHPNTPPVICKQLIQFFVTANPSPDYVERVQNVFVDNGSGVRGDLGAVIKTILLDEEAREPQYFLQADFGKLKEPVLRMTALARAFHLGRHSDLVWWDLGALQNAGFQVPTNAPSVFNYFRPDYQAPGEVRAENLVSPVFQIADSFTSIAFPNHLWDILSNGFPGGIGRGSVDRFALDYKQTNVIADDTGKLIDRMNLLFCAGRMSVATRDELIAAIDTLPVDYSPQQRAVLAAYLTLCSPDGAILK